MDHSFCFGKNSTINLKKNLTLLQEKIGFKISNFIKKAISGILKEKMEIEKLQEEYKKQAEQNFKVDKKIDTKLEKLALLTCDL